MAYAACLSDGVHSQDTSKQKDKWLLRPLIQLQELSFFFLLSLLDMSALFPIAGTICSLRTMKNAFLRMSFFSPQNSVSNWKMPLFAIYIHR